MTGRRALVTGVDTAAGRSLVRMLHRRGVAVVGTTAAPVRDLPLLALHVTHSAEHPSFLPELVRLATEHEVTWVIPTAAAELPVVAAGRSGFPSPKSVIVAGPGPVALTHDALLSAWHLAARDVPVPQTGVPTDFRDSAEALEWLGGPFVLKARRPGRPGSVRLVRSPDQVDLGRLDDGLVVQAFAPGDEFAAVVWRAPQGDLTLALLRRPGIRAGGVVGTVDLVPVAPGAEPDVEWAVRAAVRALGITGPAHLVLRRGRDGRPLVLGVEARFGDSLTAAPHVLDAALGLDPDADSMRESDRRGA